MYLFLFLVASATSVALLLAHIKIKKVHSKTETSLRNAETKLSELESKLQSTTEEMKKEINIITERNLKLEIDKRKVEHICDDQLNQIEKLKAAIKPDSFDGFFPICSNCKDIRDPKGYWHPIEEYIQSLSETDFSHSLCPECAKKLYPDLFDGEKKAICLKWKPGSDKPI